MEVILNIGCKSDKLGEIPALWVLNAVRFQPIDEIRVVSNSVHQSDTEKTVVLVVEIDPIRASDRIHRLAEILGQDCIACYAPAGHTGILIGPKAAAWGPFNPEFFIIPDGTRLSAPAAAKAA